MSIRAAAVALLLTLLLQPLGWLGSTAPSPAVAAEDFALPVFRSLWEGADAPVADGRLSRTWLWGPEPISAGRQEPYAEAPGGSRLVQYFDKSRMEDHTWRALPDSPWRVTNGLLVVELVTGQQQTGDAQFEARAPARVNVAGDPGSGPTYADLAGLRSAPPLPDGATVTARLLPGGQVVEMDSPPVAVRTSHLVPGPQHTIADPFWDFMSGPGAVEDNPFFATGFPITEPYWTEVQVAGQPRSVLLQAFERRVLTYTPGNPAGFTVEMGNVGRHYHEWRYGLPPGGPAVDPGPPRPTPLLVPPALAGAVAADPSRRFVDKTVQLPPGFSISLYALVKGPRFMAFSPAGDLYVAEPWEGAIAVLPDRDRDGVADEQIIFAGGLKRPHSLAFHGGAVYVGESNRVVRLEDRDGDLRADATTVIVSDLPDGGSHWTRTVAFGPDGKLYVSVGSSCNICIETDWHRATILQYNPDGSDGRVYAGGLRNSVGLTWQPGSGRFYATENGRDNMGDDRPPEEINEIRDGGDYGWPRCHGADIRDPRHGQAADACANQIAPVVPMQAHSAPLGLTFVTSPAFPAAYNGDLIVAFHGSWNRRVPTGYKLVRVPFRDGQPTGAVEDFLTGFLTGNEAWSRPVGVTFGPDGALYMSDDRGHAVFRITYTPA